MFLDGLAFWAQAWSHSIHHKVVCPCAGAAATAGGGGACAGAWCSTPKSNRRCLILGPPPPVVLCRFFLQPAVAWVVPLLRRLLLHQPWEVQAVDFRPLQVVGVLP